jgi:hypothetical protein
MKTINTIVPLVSILTMCAPLSAPAFAGVAQAAGEAVKAAAGQGAGQAGGAAPEANPAQMVIRVLHIQQKSVRTSDTPNGTVLHE